VWHQLIPQFDLPILRALLIEPELFHEKIIASLSAIAIGLGGLAGCANMTELKKPPAQVRRLAPLPER